MTPEQVKAYIADRLAPKIRATLTQSDFTDAWQALTPAERDSIIAAAIAGNTADAGEQLGQMLNRFARAAALDRANVIVSDGSMNLAEFGEVFG